MTPKADNQFSRINRKIDRAPAFLRRWLRSFLFGRFIRFAGTSGLVFEEVSHERVVVHIPNRPKVQNHIKGVHAAAMALLAETATGFAFGMHLPDDKLPLIKSLKVEYKKRSKGDMRAEARIDAADIARMHRDEKGDVLVPVTVTDESGESPIVCEMIWAWVPKKRG
jgi:acyl-coenzyme A thioesterase PaaI-like protein